MFRGLPHEEWVKIRNKTMRLDDYRCQRCLNQFKDRVSLTVHHIMPRSKGGSNDRTNLITLCIRCHDFVELDGTLTTRGLIEASMEEEPIEIPEEAPDDDSAKVCKIKNCKKPVYGRKLCRKHYERARRNGEFDGTMYLIDPDIKPFGWADAHRPEWHNRSKRK